MENNHRLRVYDSIFGLLSSEENPTPLVRLQSVVPLQHARIYAKLEWYNPFGAIKDRIAFHMIEDAEARGALGPGNRLVEATSGNTGLGLAMIGNTKGYPLQTPMSAEIPLEKRTILRFFGSEVIELDDTLCPAPGAPEGAIALARQMSRQPGTVLLDQYANPANPESHYKTTGPEIWRQTAGAVTHFIAGLGTCGTITGTGRFLKEKRETVQVIGVYPEEGHSIPGVRSQRQLQQTEFYRPEAYDAEVEVTNREAFDLCLRLNREESIIAGPSSGMALAGALKLLPDTPDTLAVVIFPDNVFKYASTIVRLFPAMVPARRQGQEDGGATGSGSGVPSASDRFVAELMENLKNPYDSIAVTDLAGWIAETPKPLVIDTRTPDRFSESHVPGSLNIPEEELPGRVSELPPDRSARIVMVCDVGKGSKRTTLYLKSIGYKEVRSLKGGISEWIRKGQPTAALPKR